MTERKQATPIHSLNEQIDVEKQRKHFQAWREVNSKKDRASPLGKRGTFSSKKRKERRMRVIEAAGAFLFMLGVTLAYWPLGFVVIGIGLIAYAQAENS